ncbi:hypothetical protein [Streptomyces olivaceus]|uniref:hypothetical protein n=1 Tax=Streptomyces olivaceus TaxID=47716 RepID=UPI0040576FCF
MNPTATTEGARDSAGPARPEDLAAALLTQEARRDPYPFYARMRREDPVHRSAQGIWYLTRYSDVEAALGDLRLSNDRDRMTRAYTALGGDLKALSRLTDRLGRVMSNTDPPDHARLRKLANRAFTARRVESLRHRVQGIVDGLIDEAVAAGPTMDLVEAVASPPADGGRLRALRHPGRRPPTGQDLVPPLRPAERGHRRVRGGDRAVRGVPRPARPPPPGRPR